MPLELAVTQPGHMTSPEIGIPVWTCGTRRLGMSFILAIPSCSSKS